MDAVNNVDTVVIGAGIIGLACAAAIAVSGREVLILDAEKSIGTGVSSRSSEVIHAGIYYPQNSLKARACVNGNRLLRQYAESHGIPFRMIGKLIVSTNAHEEEILSNIQKKAEINGVPLKWLSKAESFSLEPQLNSTATLLSSSTGIIDTHALMLSLLGQAEAHGATLVLQCPVLKGEAEDDGVLLHIGGTETFNLKAQHVVIAGGLSSPHIAQAFGLKTAPKGHMCKGSYFSLTGHSPFSHLIYPVPVSGGLGIHYTVDMGGRGRFGPDVEWIEREDYRVSAEKRDLFAAAIQRYWPGCRPENLEPAYSGIRPKICGPDNPDEDFLILSEKEHGLPGIVALLGIESPGITSALALAQIVQQLIAQKS